jgi:spermidine/putrescine transport system substrate-binding protein
MKNRFFLLFNLILLLISVFTINNACSRKEGKEGSVDSVKLLGWIGYGESDLLASIERETGILVEVKEYQGGTEMFSILERDQSYDIVVLDPEFIHLLYENDYLIPLNKNDFNFENYHPFFRDKVDQIWIDKNLYAIPVRFGIIGIMYNQDRVDRDDISSYSNLFGNKKYENRIAVMNLWQAVMGAVSLGLGFKPNPYDLSKDQLEKIEETLFVLKQNGLKIFTQVSSLVESLDDESTWIMLGGGEANTERLKNRGENFDWVIPREGAILWMETLGILKNSSKKDAALKVLNFLYGAEGQALLARRNAYISSPPNLEAHKLLTKEELEVRHISDYEEMDSLLENVVIRRLPKKEMTKKWIDIWEKIKR